jgi:tRNA splicing endonuclease
MPFIITKPLEIQKQEFILEVNKQASDKILSKYPIYKQLNLSQDQTSSECISMYAWINQIRTLCNKTKDSITTATNMPEIKQIEAEFSNKLSTLD